MDTAKQHDVEYDHRRWCILLPTRMFSTHPASSSTLLTMQTIRWNNWLGLMQTSSPRTFTAFVTLANDRTLFFRRNWILLNSFHSIAFMDASPADRASSQLTAAFATTPLAKDARRGDARWNGLCRFNQAKNAAVPAWSRLWLDSRKSTRFSDVTQATPPNVSIASITRDAAGIEWTHLAIVYSDVPHPRVRTPVVFYCHVGPCATPVLVRPSHCEEPMACEPVVFDGCHAGILELIVHSEEEEEYFLFDPKTDITRIHVTMVINNQ